MTGVIDLRRLRAGPAMLLCLLALGCSSKAPAPGAKESAGGSGAPPIAQTSSDEFHYDDPCSLLEPKEVEAVLGSPLGAPPFRSKGGPGAGVVDGEYCVYATANHQFIQVGVDFTGGRTAYSMANFAKGLLSSGGGNAAIQHAVKQSFKLDDGTELAGEWDEATLMPMNCCIFEALRGDQKIEIDFTGSDATLKQAASLVDAAFRRIDKPLKIDGGASSSIAAAAELETHRMKPVDPCSVLTRAEVEALIGKLAADPASKVSHHGTDTCTYELPSSGIRRIFELDFTWRGGYYKWRSDSHVAAIGTGALTTVARDVRGNDAAAATNEMLKNKALAANDAWEHAEFHAMGFAAVKKDLLVEIKGLAGTGVSGDAATRIVAAAMRKF